MKNQKIRKIEKIEKNHFLKRSIKKTQTLTTHGNRGVGTRLACEN